MDKGLPRLPRRLVLPEELTSNNSKLGKWVEIATRAAEAEMPGAKALAEDVRVLAKQTCMHYRPDITFFANGIMCDSGHNGIPYIGRKCCDSGCLLSQVKTQGLKYFYMGGESDNTADSLVEQIFTAECGK